MAITKILLDTHIFLRLNQAPERLAKETLNLVESSATELYLSAASAWEISIKYHLKKLLLPEPPEIYIPKRMKLNQLIELPITSVHALKAGGFLTHHKDPFDRLLAAQAVMENIPLLTADRKFVDFSCALIWAC